MKEVVRSTGVVVIGSKFELNWFIGIDEPVATVDLFNGKSKELEASVGLIDLTSDPREGALLMHEESSRHDVSLLEALGEAFGWTVEDVPSVLVFILGEPECTNPAPDIIPLSVPGLGMTCSPIPNVDSSFGTTPPRDPVP